MRALLLLRRLCAPLLDRRGATAIEYGLVVALVALTLVTVVSSLGDSIRAYFVIVTDAISSAY